MNITLRLKTEKDFCKFLWPTFKVVVQNIFRTKLLPRTHFVRGIPSPEYSAMIDVLDRSTNKSDSITVHHYIDLRFNYELHRKWNSLWWIFDDRPSEMFPNLLELKKKRRKNSSASLSMMGFYECCCFISLIKVITLRIFPTTFPLAKTTQEIT